MNRYKNEDVGDFDTSDSPQEPTPGRAGGPPRHTPIRVSGSGGPPRKLPGANNAPYVRKIRKEATPFTSQRRSRAPTEPMPVAQEEMFDVQIPGVGTYRVPASDPRAAALRVDAYIRGGNDPDVGKRNFDFNQFKVTPAPNEGATGGSLAGYQEPVQDSYEARLKEAIRGMVREVVRKKAGGGGYVLYGPNKGKKKQAKPAGEFPTRLAAKQAELARFPPKDPEQLKKARKRIDRLMKDPKKRADAEKKEITKKPKRHGKPAGQRKKAVREALIAALARDLHERLFHEDEVPGSPWDERIGSLHPDALASDKKLASFHKGMEKASIGALGDAHKGLGKALRGMATVHPGDIAYDPDRSKTFMPVMLDCDGVEVGPVHLYIDGGHVKIEVSKEARAAIASLDPDAARDLRGGLMSFEEDHLPRIDGAQKAWAARDQYLDKLHGKLEKHASGLSGVESHLLKQLLTKGKKR
ncbi:MAG TPA: hypothetical protein VFT74_18965 [Isosphaeraceae bacterium]|nr:hypothetical protein [Isosphaeraceae bacterium]